MGVPSGWVPLLGADTNPEGEREWLCQEEPVGRPGEGAGEMVLPCTLVGLKYDGRGDGVGRAENAPLLLPEGLTRLSDDDET